MDTHNLRVSRKIPNMKIEFLPRLKQIIRELKKEGKTIVFTNGCFDLLHIGHVRYLEKAKSFGDVLVVAINTDSSVRKNKGETRPFVPESHRAEIVASLESVDYVVLFEEPTPEKIIGVIQPDVLVKGADYAKEEVVGADIVENNGGRVILIPLIAGCSTSSLINKIKQTV